MPHASVPGFARGLSIIGNVAAVGLSKPRNQRFEGLQLDDELKYGESFLSAGIPWQRFRRRDPEPCGRFPDGEWLSY